jgi:hypothetical protein
LLSRVQGNLQILELGGIVKVFFKFLLNGSGAGDIDFLGIGQQVFYFFKEFYPVGSFGVVSAVFLLSQGCIRKI